MVIIEGPQGTGKTTLANYLRDNMAESNLYRLSCQQDTYLQISDELSECDNIYVNNLAMDNFTSSYNEVRRVLKIK